MTMQSSGEPFQLEVLPAQLWGVARMALEFKVQPATVRRWARRGLIPRPALKRDGRSFWDPAQLEPFRRERLRRLAARK
jgi:hypothetical protein